MQGRIRVRLGVYSDVDIIWLADVSLLWRRCNDATVFQAPHEQMEGTLTKEDRWFADHHVAFNRERYFCAGLALLNLRKLREATYIINVVEFLSIHKDVQFADQTALNAILLNDVTLLDNKWHTLTACAQENDLLRPTTLHFAGDAPWKISQRQDILSDTAMLWFRYYAHTIGSSTWKCLRNQLSFSQIVFKRLFFLCFASSKIAKAMLFSLFHLLHRDGSTEYFKVRLRRVTIRNDLIPTVD